MSKVLTFIALAGTVTAITAVYPGFIDGIADIWTGYTGYLKPLCSGVSCDHIFTKTPEEYCEDNCFKQAYELFKRGNSIFGGNLFQEMLRVQPGENVFGSSPVMLSLLAQLTVNANPNEDTYKQIMAALNFNDKKYVECYFRRIIPIVMEPGQLQWTAKIYSDNTTCPLTKEFLEQDKELFIFRSHNLDFKDPESAEIINKEVAAGTGNHIFNYISSQELSRYTGLILLSAEYFKGAWAKPFNPRYTKARDFYVTNTEVIKLSTMYQRDTFLYKDSKKIGGRILKLDYTGREFSLILIDPHHPDNLANVVKNIGDPNIFLPEFHSLRRKHVEVYLPTFNRTASHMMRGYIERAGVTAIFSNKTAGLHTITKCKETYVSQIMQKVTFQVDEMGSSFDEYSDCSSEEKERSKRKKSIVFRLNHPFIFLLFYRDFIAFFGIFVR